VARIRRAALSDLRRELDLSVHKYIARIAEAESVELTSDTPPLPAQEPAASDVKLQEVLSYLQRLESGVGMPQDSNSASEERAHSEPIDPIELQQLASAVDGVRSSLGDQTAKLSKLSDDVARLVVASQISANDQAGLRELVLGLRGERTNGNGNGAIHETPAPGPYVVDSTTPADAEDATEVADTDDPEQPTEESAAAKPKRRGRKLAGRRSGARAKPRKRRPPKISAVEARDRLIALRWQIWNDLHEGPSDDGVLRRRMLDLLIRERVTNKTQLAERVPPAELKRTSRKQLRYLPQIFRIIRQIA
jgi:hypothetical protein